MQVLNYNHYPVVYKAIIQSLKEMDQAMDAVESQDQLRKRTCNVKYWLTSYFIFPSNLTLLNKACTCVRMFAVLASN